MSELSETHGDLDDLDDDELDDANTVDDANTLDDGDDDANRIHGGRPRAVLEHLARSIVDDPDAVVIDADEGRGSVSLRLHVAPSDMGRVIGRRGRVAQAIRTVVRAAGAKEGLEADVDIVD